MAAPRPFNRGASSSSSSAAAAATTTTTSSSSSSSAAGVTQYRVPPGVGLDAYSSLDDPYRLPFDQMPQTVQIQPGQQQEQDPNASRAGHGSITPLCPAIGHFGILTPTPMPDVEQQPGSQQTFTPQKRNNGNVELSNGQLSKKVVIDPPDLAKWRERLFNVDGMIVLTNEQFETYFPHIDNVYSHRSTQRYKRKPFVSHYWDCRMKGRPPGTPKSDDPNKKKRKRNARERDLCDVKIKITEYLPGAQIQLENEDDGSGKGMFATTTPAQLNLLASDSSGAPAVGGGQRIWSIQRVSGNGGDLKDQGASGSHKHTLEKSDEIKKNSVQRHLAKQEKDAKKMQRLVVQKATGAALTTAKEHSKENDLKLYAACFCPFSQRVWIALEAKGLAYQYCEMDPYKTPTPEKRLEVNPRGLVPAIRQGDWACAESGIILEYLEDLDPKTPLLPRDPRLKATCRLWIDHINARIVPAFYALLQNGHPNQHDELMETLSSSIDTLITAANESGPFFLGENLCLVDIHFAPFSLRLSRLLAPMRDWQEPLHGTRLHRWLMALEEDAHVQSTTSTRELYMETAGLLARGSVER